ncbi:hypothetical protein PIB30_030214 [Stylosanthes scabra]|uniref:Secreted protein n=1 Tax=Stylosanthes scabra TaxID=79078 RepID=A0ABU6UBQ7_9FABA|nr:hypothetical protein [Stylosanthes scabra]
MRMPLGGPIWTLVFRFAPLWPFVARPNVAHWVDPNGIKELLRCCSRKDEQCKEQLTLLFASSLLRHSSIVLT